MQFTDSSHNVLFTLNEDKWRQDLAKSAKASITGYQEAGDNGIRRVLKEFCDERGRSLFHPEGCGNPISWDPKVFTAVPGEAGTLEVHAGAGFAKYNPARDVAYQGLKHIASGKQVLRINVHATSGGTAPEPNKFDRRLNDWKDWAIGQYWLDVMAFTAKQMSRGPRYEGKAYWDAILLGGDYNGDLRNKGEWYYPARLLPALYVDDARRPKGLDHLQHTHGSDVKVAGRTTAKGHTDHLIQFVSRTIANVDDFPAGK